MACFRIIIGQLCGLFRVYLGLALSLQKDGPGSRLQECVGYLLEGMEVLLTDLSKQAATSVEKMCVFCQSIWVTPGSV